MSIPAMKRIHDIFVILPEFKVAICLTPKVASTSIAHAISSYYGAKLERPFHANSVFRWFTLKQVKEFVPDYKRVMFVRNPFDRLVGCYEYHIVATNLQMSANMRALGFRADMNFDEFLVMVFKNTEADAHFAMQAWQTDRCDFVGKFENLDKDWKKMRDMFKMPLPNLENKNKNKRRSYKEYYPDHWKKRVFQVYSEDFNQFGYGF